MTGLEGLPFNDERYAAVGDLVIRAALDARAKLEAVELELFNSDINGRATAKELEERKALLENDATKLGRMAMYVDRNWASGNDRDKTQTQAETPIIPQTDENSNGNTSANGYSITRLSFRSEETREVFYERTSRLVIFMAEQGNDVTQEDGISAGKILRSAMGMELDDWGSYSTRLQKVGILVCKKLTPASKRVTGVRLDQERIKELIELGDLPADLAEKVEKLDESTEPTRLELVRIPKIEEKGEVLEEPQNDLPPDLQRRMRNGLSSIRTRHTGAHTHGRAQAV